MSSSARILAVLVAGSLFTAPAKADDELSRFKAENDLKAQKLTGEVKAGLAKARALERTDPTRAQDILRGLERRLQDDAVLSHQQRLALLRQVREQLQGVSRAVQAQEAAGDAAARKALRQQKEFPRRDGDRQTSPQNPSSVAKDYYRSANERLEEMQKLRTKSDSGFRGALTDIDRSAADIQEARITDRFVMATQNRVQKLTAKEKALLKTLNSVLSVNFNNDKFREVIDYLQERTGQAIIIDDGSLKEANVDQDDPVTFQAKKITVRTILRKILGDKGLTYIIRDGTLQVVTPQRARESMIVRTYPISDLVGANSQFGFWGRLMTYQMAQTLIQTIQSTVEPEIWSQGASIVFYPPSMSLVVRAPAEIHYSMGYGAK